MRRLYESVMTRGEHDLVESEGVNAGDQVVVDGTDRLQEGMTVRIRKPGEVEAIAASGLNAGRGRGGFKKGGGGQNGDGRNGGGRKGGDKQ